MVGDRLNLHQPKVLVLQNLIYTGCTINKQYYPKRKLKMLTVQQVLSSKSAQSLQNQLNHNCIVDAISYHHEYGVIFTLYKFTTGVTINLDIKTGEAWQVVLSQGRGYQRFFTDARVLWKLRPTVQRVIQTALDSINSIVEAGNNPAEFLEQVVLGWFHKYHPELLNKAFTEKCLSRVETLDAEDNDESDDKLVID